MGFMTARLMIEIRAQLVRPPNGKLTDSRTWADLSKLGPNGERVLPDGICIDSEDGIWVSDPAHSRARPVDKRLYVCAALNIGGQYFDLAARFPQVGGHALKPVETTRTQ